jgi:hypothetical protein
MRRGETVILKAALRKCRLSGRAPGKAASEESGSLAAPCTGGRAPFAKLAWIDLLAVL